MADSKPATVVTALRGIDERWEPPATEAGGLSAVEATDLWWHPRGGWQSSGGYDRLIRGPSAGGGNYTNPFTGRGAIESVHYFPQHGLGRSWFIYIDGDGVLYQFNPSTAARAGSSGDIAKDREGTSITRAVVQTPWQRSQSVNVADRFYMVNGIDEPLVFDGERWDRAGWQSGPTAPSAVTMLHPHANDSGSGGAIRLNNIGLGATSETGGEDYPFARRYKFTFFNERGAESPPSEASDIVYFTNTGGTSISDGAHFAKVSAPLGPRRSCVARGVYCTQNLYDSSGILVAGRDSQFFFHSVIQDNITEAFQDGRDDAFIGASSLLDETQLGPWPRGAKYIAHFKDRLYLMDDVGVWYSRRGGYEVIPRNNFIPIDGAECGALSVLYASRNALIVARSHRTFLIEDDGVNEPRARVLAPSVGFSSQNTVKEVPGLGIMGLSGQSVTLLKGTLQNEGVETQTFNTAVCLPVTMGRINTSALLNACAVVYAEDKEYQLYVPTLGSPVNRLGLIFHYEIREWTTRENFPVASVVVLPANAGGHVVFASYAATTGISPDGVVHLGLFMYSRGAPDKDGTAITPVYETNNISIASAFRTFKPLHVLINCILHGDNVLTLNCYGNDSQSPFWAVAKEVMQQYPQDRLPVYGLSGGRATALFGSGALWQEWHHGTVRFDINAPTQQPLFAIALRFTPASGKRYMTLLGFSLEIQGNDPTQTKPLRPDGA